MGYCLRGLVDHVSSNNKVVIACGMSERRGGDTKVADVFGRADAAM